MAFSTFVTRMVNGQPILPPRNDPDGGPQLDYDYVGGVPQKGGYSVVGPAPQGTVMVLLEAPENTIAAMKADPSYLWAEDL